MATPMRLFRKNHVKATRNRIDTTTPRAWIGGTVATQIEIGVSGSGNGRALVSAPTVMGGRPRRMAASPMVAMITATTESRSFTRSTTRSSAKLKRIMMPTVSATAPTIGRLAATSEVAAIYPASITNSPCAKLIASVAL